MEYTPWMIGLAALVLIGLLGLIGRFFFRLLKHLIIAIIIGVVAAFVWYQMQPRPVVDPAIGKRAYSSANGQFVGTVVGTGTDRQMGDILIIQQPGGYKVKYPKSFLLLRDR